MPRRLLIGLTVIVAMLGAGVTVYWYIACRRLSDGVAGWAQARRAEGWEITAGNPSLAGWPMVAAIVLPGFGIAGGDPDIPGGASWSADRLRVELSLLHPVTLDVLGQGTQRIGPQHGPGLPFTAELTRIRLPLQPVPARTADVTIHALRAHPQGLAIDNIDARIAVDPAAVRDGAALAMRLNAAGIVLPAGVNWPFGAHIAGVSGDGELGGPIPPPLGFSADATAWRTAGGVVRIRRLDLQWGPLDASLTGTASLDEALQPTAQGEVQASNYGAALDTLAARRIIGNDAALAAKAVLSLLASVPAGGGPAQVTVPFTIRDRTVAIRGIPLLKLPEVRWPGPP